MWMLLAIVLSAVSFGLGITAALIIFKKLVSPVEKVIENAQKQDQSQKRAGTDVQGQTAQKIKRLSQASSALAHPQAHHKVGRALQGAPV